MPPKGCRRFQGLHDGVCTHDQVTWQMIMTSIFAVRSLARYLAYGVAWSLAFLITGSVAWSQFGAAENRPTRQFDCVIEPQQIVKLANPVVGVIAQLDVDRGDIVHKGQIIGRMEDGVEAATLALARAKASNEFPIKSAEARLQFLRRKLGRVSPLAHRGAASQVELDDAEAQASIAVQQLKEAKLNRELARLEVRHAEEVLNQRTIRSPIDGVVVERLLVPGEYRNDQSPIMTLAQIDPLRIETYVPIAYYGEIQVDSQAKVYPESPIGGVHAATVVVVDHVLDAASGTFGVRLALPNSDHGLPAGIRCKVEFDIRSTEHDKHRVVQSSPDH
jgi:RND family efflux transporter MFP subunit